MFENWLNAHNRGTKLKSGWMTNTFLLWRHEHISSLSLFKVMEDRLAQRRLFLGVCVHRAWGLSSNWRDTSCSSGVQLPARTLWLRKVQTDSHLPSWLEVCMNGKVHVNIHSWPALVIIAILMVPTFAEYILLMFQGKNSRMVQQSLWSPLCCWCCTNPQLLPSSHCRGPRDQDLIF